MDNNDIRRRFFYGGSDDEPLAQDKANGEFLVAVDCNATKESRAMALVAIIAAYCAAIGAELPQWVLLRGLLGWWSMDHTKADGISLCSEATKANGGMYVKDVSRVFACTTAADVPRNLANARWPAKLAGVCGKVAAEPKASIERAQAACARLGITAKPPSQKAFLTALTAVQERVQGLVPTE